MARHKKAGAVRANCTGLCSAAGCVLSLKPCFGRGARLRQNLWTERSIESDKEAEFQIVDIYFTRRLFLPAADCSEDIEQL